MIMKSYSQNIVEGINAICLDILPLRKDEGIKKFFKMKEYGAGKETISKIIEGINKKFYIELKPECIDSDDTFISLYLLVIKELTQNIRS